MRITLLLAIVVASCGPAPGPGPEVPDCPAGTISTVCETIGYATCHPPDSLEPVVGCAVSTTSLGVPVRIKCVASCS